MEVTYDAEVDILAIVLDVRPAKESKEILPGVVADFDQNHRVITLEIFDAKEIAGLSQVKVAVSPGHDRIIPVSP